MDSDQEVGIVRDIALEAGSMLLSYFRSSSVDARSKGDKDVVTAADFAVEELVRRRLGSAFPSDGIRGEEGTEVAPGAGRLWCIDPLDGTLNFSRGVPMWCVSISLFVSGEPRLGVIYDPLRDECFSAAAGRGARLNGHEVKTSGLDRIADAFVHLTVDFHDPSREQGLEDLVRLAPGILRSRNLGSAALALAYVACGRFDAMLHRYAHEWDYGAGVALVREAGGSASAIDGADYDVDTRAVAVAATDKLRTALLAAIETETAPLE